MEIRLAHPNEIEAIVNVLEEARAFLASSGIHQWQGEYPNKDNIFESFEKINFVKLILILVFFCIYFIHFYIILDYVLLLIVQFIAICAIFLKLKIFIIFLCNIIFY